MKKHFGVMFIFLTFLLCACPKKKTSIQPKVEEKEVKEIAKQINIKINRYDSALFAIPKENLANGLLNLQKEYYFFIGDNPTSAENLQQMRAYLNDPIVKQLHKQVDKVFPNCEDLEKDFTNAFSLLKYHFPQANIPQIYGIVSGLNYQMPILYYDSVLVISLDMYLGRNYKLYKQLGSEIPQYIYRRYSKEYILPDCFKEMAFQYISFKASNTILEEMIIEGKRMMFAQTMLPEVSDTLIFGFSQEKMDWLYDNEFQIWAFLIEQNLLFSKDKMAIRKLVGDAPFTPYFSKMSPGRAGAWVGWQICRNWIKNNPDKPISELFSEKDGQKILTQSKYKPKNKKQ